MQHNHFARQRHAAGRLRPSECGRNSWRKKSILVSLPKFSLSLSGPSSFPSAALMNAASSCVAMTARAFSGGAGASRRNKSVAAAALISCARMKPGASTGLMPANVLLKERASVTAGVRERIGTTSSSETAANRSLLTIPLATVPSYQSLYGSDFADLREGGAWGAES